MSWTSPPDKIVEARDAILACAASSTLGLGSSGSYHYPLAAVKTDTLPFCVLEETEYGMERHAPGESYGRGRITAIFYIDPAVLAMGAAEEAARDLVDQLVSLTGDALFITSARRGLSTKPRKSKTAGTVNSDARSYFTLQISMEWEG